MEPRDTVLLDYLVGDKVLLLKGLTMIYYSGLLALGVIFGLIVSVILLALSNNVQGVAYAIFVAAVFMALVNAGFFVGLRRVDNSFLTSCGCFEAGVVVLANGLLSLLYLAYMLFRRGEAVSSLGQTSSIILALLNGLSLIALGLALVKINKVANESALSLAGTGLAVSGLLSLVPFLSKLASLLYLLSLIVMCYGLNKAIADLRMRLCHKEPSLCKYA